MAVSFQCARHQKKVSSSRKHPRVAREQFQYPLLIRGGGSGKCVSAALRVSMLWLFAVMRADKEGFRRGLADKTPARMKTTFSVAVLFPFF